MANNFATCCNNCDHDAIAYYHTDGGVSFHLCITCKEAFELGQANADKDVEMLDDETDDETAEFSVRYLKDNIYSWDDFCDDMGLNPWAINEGLMSYDDTLNVPITILRKHGLIR